MSVLAIVDDLMFRATIEAAAVQAGAAVALAKDRSALGSRSELMLVDLHLTADDPLAVVALAKRLDNPPRIVGFYSHVQTELAQRAQQAGCDLVLPRSAFVRELPRLLAAANPVPPTAPD